MPKKRRHVPPPPTRGIFTRSRSEIFLHRNRSGHARSDPARRRCHHLVSTSPKPSPVSSSRAFSPSVKDLRSRRVFSPASLPISCSPDPTVKTTADDDRTVDIDQQESTPLRSGALDEPSEIGDGGPASVDQVVKVSPGVSETEVGVCQPPMDLSSISKSRQGLVPCSRLKLFRNPSSFSYRRMLPFLMNLARDGSSRVEILSCQNYRIKMEQNVEESSLLQNVDPSSKQEHQGSLCVQPRESSDIFEISVSKNPILGPLGDAVSDMMALMLPPDSCSERALQVYEAAPEFPSEDALCEPDLLYNSTYCSPCTRITLSVEELTGHVRSSSYLPNKVEKNEGLIVPSLAIDMKPSLGTAPSQALQSCGRHALAPKKGILKRNTRVCRGLCMCLDCALFRIHAERAFDFSRKQMQEADEVVSVLMKELSLLRELVENSVMPTNSGIENSTIQFNQEQVKRFCRRVVRVEELAKNRMKQMFHDLNSHCRPHGQRVAFAEYVEERMI